uniref:Bm1078 n=1 Tax=Brugia malayi TaxID=6279 RepID=A0A0J9Y6V8_BRUMA|nr:Bm1078 [Brugia malayi]
MSLIEEMKTLDDTKLISMQSDNQILSQQLLNEKKKLLHSNLLQLANGNSMLRASLILLTLVMIFFTIVKTCKLFYQIRYQYQQKREINESDSEIPEILIKTHSTDDPYFVNKKSNKTKHKLNRTFRIWNAKSNFDSNPLPNKKIKFNLSLSNKSDSKCVKAKKIYPVTESNLKSSLKSTETKNSDTNKTMTTHSEKHK